MVSLQFMKWIFILLLHVKGPHKRLLQCQHLQRSPHHPHHVPGPQPDSWRSQKPTHWNYDYRQAKGAHRHVFHQHLQHPGCRSQPSVWLQPALRPGHRQQLHWTVWTGVSAELTQWLQLLYRHAVWQQCQQLQQAGWLCAVRQGQQDLGLILLPLLTVLLPKLRPHQASAETHADPCLKACGTLSGITRMEAMFQGAIHKCYTNEMLFQCLLGIPAVGQNMVWSKSLMKHQAS